MDTRALPPPDYKMQLIIIGKLDSYTITTVGDELFFLFGGEECYK